MSALCRQSSTQIPTRDRPEIEAVYSAGNGEIEDVVPPAAGIMQPKLDDERLPEKLHEAIRNLHLVQSQLELIRRSSSFKLACRGRQIVEYFVPPDGKYRRLNRYIRWVSRILLDQGIVALLVMTAYRLMLFARRLFHFRAERRRDIAA